MKNIKTSIYHFATRYSLIATTLLCILCINVKAQESRANSPEHPDRHMCCPTAPAQPLRWQRTCALRWAGIFWVYPLPGCTANSRPPEIQRSASLQGPPHLPSPNLLHTHLLHT